MSNELKAAKEELDRFHEALDRAITGIISECDSLRAQLDTLTQQVDRLTQRAVDAEGRASLAEIERDTAQAQVRAKQSWIDGMKVDYDALNDEANTWRQRAEEAEEVVGSLRKEHLHHTMAAEQSILAAERTVREQREHEAWHCTVEGRTTPCGTCDGCRWHISSLRAALAESENTVREQREALMAVSEFGCDECGDFGDTCLDRHSTEPTKWCQTCIAIAALAPNTEGEGT